MDRNEEKANRSVFVGNIPFETSEENLRRMFSEIGHIKSFRLVTDRETGRPKGFGFVEYADIATAQSAIRNLQNREINGRVLRIDSASQAGLAGGNSQYAGVIHNPMNYGPNTNQGNMNQNPGNLQNNIPVTNQNIIPPKPVKEEGKYGDVVLPKDAPEAISKVVASLPPEQMFELMKEMKECIKNNPHEARNMLLQNPQLAYALLQAQVVMRIVDPEIAMKMLHRQAPVQPLVSSGVPTRQLPANTDKARQLDNHLNTMRSTSTASKLPQNIANIQNKKSNDMQTDIPLSASSAMENMTGTDREKAQLIMQVMNLSVDQINMLPAGQRQSIIELREQLQASGALQGKK